MVTYVSLRLAMKRIVQAACGMLCEDVVVITPKMFEPKMYLVQVPAELRPDVYLHIAENLDVRIPLAGDALYLPESAAEKLQEYAETLPRLRFDLVLRDFEDEVRNELVAVGQK